MERNQKWLKEKSQKQKKMKEKIEKKEMNECTFKPKTYSKDFLKKK